MEEMECPACHQRVIPREPRQRFWGVIVTFWIFSLLFGICASFSAGWGGVMLIAWIALACAVGLTAGRSSGWACPRCGVSLLGGPRGPAEVV